MNKPVHILIAVRKAIDRSGLACLVNGVLDIRLVGVAATLDDAAAKCALTRPDVVVFDAGFPRLGAFSTARDLTERAVVGGVLFLDDDVSALRVGRAVAIPNSSYYTKDADIDEIFAAIRQLASGVSSFDLAVRDFIIRDKRSRSLKLRIDGPSIGSLSKRELEVMKLLAEGNTVRAVAGHLQLSPNTVDNHKSRLMKKLSVHSLAELTRLALHDGLID